MHEIQCDKGWLDQRSVPPDQGRPTSSDLLSFVINEIFLVDICLFGVALINSSSLTGLLPLNVEVDVPSLTSNASL